MWKNVLLLGVNCPIGEAVATKLTKFSVNLTTINVNQFKTKIKHDKDFDVIINNVFASLNVQQWLNSECTQYEEFNRSHEYRWLHISPFPLKFGETLIPEALPWSSLAYRLSANTTALREYCRNEEVIAEAVIALLKQQRNGTENRNSVTTVEKVLNNDLLKSRNVLLKGSFHVDTNSAFIDHKLFESQKLMSI